MIEIDYYYQENTIKNYPATIAQMEQRVQNIIQGHANNLLWFLEYDHLYTAGSSAMSHDLLSNKIPIYKTNRGGKHTYHGPGQQICYFIIDLKQLFGETPDLRKYLTMIAQVNINLLKTFNIDAEFSKENIGVWAKNEKITAFGIKVKKWIAYHGFALNVNTNLLYYQGIVPCGIQGSKATSIQKFTNATVNMQEIRLILLDEIKNIFFINKINKISKI